jgi:hypothetical protein
MPNSTLTASIIAKAAVKILDNECVMARQVYRAHESEFAKNVNGYKIGDTITIRKPADFTVGNGATVSAQDVVEGSTTLTIDKRKHVAFKFTSQQLTLNIGDLSERVIKPAMVQLANQVDTDIMALYAKVPRWVGTAGQVVNAFTDFIKAPEALDLGAVPTDMRSAVLSPSDFYGLLGAQSALYIQNAASGAYREGNLGKIAGIDTYMSQNVPSLTTGTRSGSILIDLSITTSTITYDAVKSTMQQTIHMDAFTGATDTIKAGEVFTIADVYDVNPVTKARLPHLKQFTVVSDATCSSNETDVVIYPAMIWTGAFKNIDVSSGTDLNNKAVTFLGSASTVYPQNMVFHKNAFAMASVPLERPPGAVDVGSESYNGLSVRVIPVYNGTDDESMWRMDILYGLQAIDPRLAVRLSGT